jgi:hypothetical protein
MVRSDETRDIDPRAQHHGSLSTLKEERSSPRDAALKPVDLPGKPMEVRIAVQKEPLELRKERERLRGEPTRWLEQPAALRMTGTRKEEMGLEQRWSSVPARL